MSPDTYVTGTSNFGTSCVNVTRGQDEQYTGNPLLVLHNLIEYSARRTKGWGQPSLSCPITNLQGAGQLAKLAPSRLLQVINLYPVPEHRRFPERPQAESWLKAGCVMLDNEPMPGRHPKLRFLTIREGEPKWLGPRKSNRKGRGGWRTVEL